MKNYKIGPGKPPLETRFKPGNQEWRKREAKRRARRAPSPTEDFRHVMGSLVGVKKNGRLKSESRLQVLVDTLVSNAIKGDVGAADAVLKLHAESMTIGDLQPFVLVFDAPGDGGDLISDPPSGKHTVGKRSGS